MRRTGGCGHKSLFAVYYTLPPSKTLEAMYLCPASILVVEGEADRWAYIKVPRSSPLYVRPGNGADG